MKNAALSLKFRTPAEFDLWDRFFRRSENGTPLSAFRKLRFSVSQPLEELPERLTMLEGFCCR